MNETTASQSQHSWKGKVAIVTGASSGVGLAVARALVRRGARVALVARTAATRVDQHVLAGPQLARTIGYAAAGADFRGVYRFLAHLISPERLLELTPRVWNTYWDRGKMQNIESREGMSRSYCSGCKGFDRSIWESIIGGSIATLELAGAKNVRVRVVSGGGDGDDVMDCEGRWTMG